MALMTDNCLDQGKSSVFSSRPWFGAIDTAIHPEKEQRQQAKKP